MNLSKSKFTNAYQCKKMLWLKENKPEVMSDIDNKSVLENGTKVGEVAKKLLGENIDIKFNENLSIMIEDTKKALLNNKVIVTEASFNYNNNFCSVDILKKDNDNYEIYEVKSSTKISDIYIEDVSYQFYILKKLGLNVTKASIVYINSNYVRKEELELNKLFKIQDVTDIAINKLDGIEQNIKDINEYMKEENEPFEGLDLKCVNPYPCPFFKYCSKDLVSPNVFDLKRISNNMKFKLYKENKISFKELMYENIKYKEQIDFTLNNKEPLIKRDKIKLFLDTLSYPMYFLDFETYQEAIPEYLNTSPYEQIPFQYSLHFYETEKGKLKHKEFLSDINIDPRRKLAEQLVKDIPLNVCVIAYNCSFEKMVIKRLAALYPDLNKHLMNIYHNIKDLMIPFKEMDYYTKEMNGSYSIKYVLPALFPNDESLNYKSLDSIHNGSEAMDSFKNLKNMSKKEQEKTRKNLLKYCELDTYAMVKIYAKLKEVVSKVIC